MNSRSVTVRANSFYRAALIYLSLPVIIFFIGYLKVWWALLFSAGIAGAVILAMRDYGKKSPDAALDPSEKKIEIKASCLIFLLIAIPLFLYWGGVGEFGNCSADHRVRYAILNDLVEYKWPVVYDYSTQQNPAVAASLGSGTAAFAYYFVFWMIPALFGKIFGLLVARIVLLIWTGIGLFLIFAGASLLYKRASRALFIFLILFAGFDVIPYVINLITKTDTTWEGWNSHLFIHGNFFQIMNVFNQSIPGWLITILLLLAKDGRVLLVRVCLAGKEVRFSDVDYLLRLNGYRGRIIFDDRYDTHMLLINMYTMEMISVLNHFDYFTEHSIGKQVIDFEDAE